MTFPVFFDTCALFGGTLNDTFLRLAELGAYQILWSDGVLTELERNLADRVGPEGARRRVSAMRAAFPDAAVADYEDLAHAMTCEPKDRHVLAAAVRGHAEVLITFNIKDFPASSLAPHAVTVVHPDDFLLDQLDLHPARVGAALIGQVLDANRPPLTMSRLLGILGRSDVPRFSAEARRHDFLVPGESND
ncbi:PIN domain-containing protein [Allobranchiibius sp. GilTou73]|uniref:PIN domain-containing protein n=1 Tax=Allobranchiibius sp. GilTou73 TaxID=2904523 RepID=UPI001F3D563C|nr:PIN domain-containing protein [Allobranchiibius sp. GilTou73]UIJ35129.1 PIN domain-containing protein [Allobranchiibius sp. GilTou73]